ncbi:MAG: class I SAM-dependent methyltransferase [Blastocatellia bacterium]|nr:class I SAM-dependent methyltransferase [Blastocatellia bacterium]
MTSLKQNVITYFERCLAEHGDSAKGVDYNGPESQFQRFQVLSQIADLQGATVHDVGCGLGHFRDFLVERGISAIYSGSDIAPGMIEQARKRHPEAEFFNRDILELPVEDLPQYDYLVCCGVFHLKAENSDEVWEEFALSLIERMFRMAKRGVAFNMMTDLVDFKIDRLFYANPSRIFDHCRHNLTRRVTLRHDYPLYEFAVYLYK